MAEELQLRIYGSAPLPTLIYLPGLHGDWTLVSAFRHAVAGQLRFVEITYPRTLTWSLDNYASAVETVLVRHDITTGWLLGESFSSQVVWAMLAHGTFSVQGVILAGGFVKYPMHRSIRLAEKITARISSRLLVWIIFGYARVARFRYRRSAETLASLDEFISRRTELDRRAAQHRLRLIAQNDPSLVAVQTRLPVFGLSGFFDPIVPWPRVRRWLRKNCPGLRDFKVILRADHNVLGTAPVNAARQVLDWML